MSAARLTLAEAVVACRHTAVRSPVALTIHQSQYQLPTPTKCATVQGTAGAALLLATAMLLAAPAAAAAAAAGSGALRHSKHWGKAGEAWSPAGPIMDFSFAGEG